jgi:folate-binding protein YgfZ
MSAEIYKLLRVFGSDAGEFLQGQLTQDMERVAGAGCMPAAWCNAKGRVITLLRVLTADAGYDLVLPASLAEPVRRKLLVYRLRAHVSLEVIESDWACLAINTDSDLDRLESLGLLPPRELNACRIANGMTTINIGIEEPCVELLGFKSDLEKAGFGEAASTDFLRGAKIRAGIPEILQNQSEKFTPHMLNQDLLGAISFDKGCYTGQEVIARTQNLGSSRRRLMRYSTESTLTSGDRLSDGQQEIGEVINVVGSDLLAVTPVVAHEKTLFAGKAEVIPARVPYL